MNTDAIVRAIENIQGVPAGVPAPQTAKYTRVSSGHGRTKTRKSQNLLIH